ncbi:hypothetical protein Droror1_Dr00000234, partial [Drosera rotundifolia]
MAAASMSLATNPTKTPTTLPTHHHRLPPNLRPITTLRSSVSSSSYSSSFLALRIAARTATAKACFSMEGFDGTRSDKDEVLKAVKGALGNCLSETNFDETVLGLTSKIRGKVRDIYQSGEYLVLVTTDRQSTFDRVLASIPFKGQVLNETSLWWFEKTQHIAPNAVVAAPDKNFTIAKKGFVTGSTDTSLWTVYKNGVRNYCGNALPDGLVKNQKLLANILTPTTKAADHDVPVTPDEIIEHGLMTKADYNEVSRKALCLFEYGQHVALEHGLILVDTKYEFGKASDGTILLVDEVHTPDSSRYWITQSYKERFQNGLEPENVDK